MKVRWRCTALFFLITVSTISATINGVDENEKFVVVRATPETLEQLAFVRKLHDKMNEFKLDFWLSPTTVGHMADVMVAASRLPWIKKQLAQHNIPHFVSVPDVQKLIMDREHKPSSSALSQLLGTKFSKRFHDEGGNKAKYGFGDYHSYDRIITWMNDIERLYPDRAKVMKIGETDEKRPIMTIKIGRNIAATDRRIVWIDGGIHAREWAAVHTTLYFIDRLIADYDSDPTVRSAIDSLHFYITPVVNPDGYEYSRSGVSPMIRLWRKNRAQMVCKKDRWFRERCCGGVDLNRNFDWFFGESGSSTDRCSEIYQGSAAFSEAEARAVRDTMMSPALKGKVDAFITLHTYSQMWIHPFSHARKTVPEDIGEIEQVGRKAVSALESVYGTKYRFGTGADILYPSAGGSDDWAKGKGGAKYVYLIELRPGEDVWDGFILDSRQLIPTGKETWAGVKVVIDAALERVRKKPITEVTSTGNVGGRTLVPNIDILAETTEIPRSTTSTISSITSTISTIIMITTSTNRTSEPSPSEPTTVEPTTTQNATEIEDQSHSTTAAPPSATEESITTTAAPDTSTATSSIVNSSTTTRPPINPQNPVNASITASRANKQHGSSASTFFRGPLDNSDDNSRDMKVDESKTGQEFESALAFLAHRHRLITSNTDDGTSFSNARQRWRFRTSHRTSTNNNHLSRPVDVSIGSGGGVGVNSVATVSGTIVPVAPVWTTTVAPPPATVPFNRAFVATPQPTRRVQQFTRRIRVKGRHGPVLVNSEAARLLLEQRFRQQQNRIEQLRQVNGGRQQQQQQQQPQQQQPAQDNRQPRLRGGATAVDGGSIAAPQRAPCIDRSPWCSSWLQQNQNVCQISSIYMRRDCARTCQFCRA